jgi:putative transposase
MKRISFNIPNHAHFLTFSCYQHQQLLTSDPLRNQLLVCWDDARHQGKFAIWAYVIMPEHVHLLIWLKSENYEMAKILRLLKESFSRWVVKYWTSVSPHLLERISIQRGKRRVRRFWQEGGGYNRNLYTWESIKKARDYIEWNPVRRGLVEDPSKWYWSSARSRMDNNDVLLKVDEIDIERLKVLYDS